MAGASGKLVMNRSPPRVTLGASRPPGASCCTGLCAVQVTWCHQRMLYNHPCPLTGGVLDASESLALAKLNKQIQRRRHAESAVPKISKFNCAAYRSALRLGWSAHPAPAKPKGGDSASQLNYMKA